MKRVVIVGGGISGLAAAHRLHEIHCQRRMELQVILLEASDRFGGLLETREQEGFLLEAGADAFLTEKPWAADLCRRIGLGEELIPTQPGLRRSQVAVRGRLEQIPEGFHLIAPANGRVLWKMPGLSWVGKLRAALESWVPPAPADRDESVAHFIRRRLGREMLDRVAGPMVGGIYTADLEQLSMRAALPRLWEMEQKHGSLSRALSRPMANGGGVSGPRYGLFLTLRRGLQQLVEAILGRMPEFALCRSAEAIRADRAGAGWRVVLKSGEGIEADQLCVALPTHRAAHLLESAVPDTAGRLREIPYASVATVSLAYLSKDLPRRLEGFGFVQSPEEGQGIVGCSFSSVKFSGRAPGGNVLLRAFVGGTTCPDLVDLPDEEITRRVRDNLRGLLGVQVPPRLVFIRRHRHAMPQYTIGHLGRVESLEREIKKHSGLTLIGNGTRGVGIPDCIHLAEQAAERISDAI